MSVLHELPLVSTIAIGLSLAFVCGLIAAKLRISPLVGYILAGVIIGPYTPGFIADQHIAEQLSEIGIVLLLFGVGLHFSVQDFLEVKKIATGGAIIRIAIITFFTVLLTSGWGLSLGAAIIFGLALSVASTVVLLRTFEENHLGQTMTAKIAIGWLIVEDIIMVLAMVMIPALAGIDLANISGAALGLELLIALGKVALFAIVMVVVGKRFLPWLLTVVSRTGSRELFTLAAFSMAMGIAFEAAILFGVSLALGAFFAGMMIRESDLNHEVADRVMPFQDAFAVLFFVSVGMLFNPQILLSRPVDVALVLGLIVVVKGIVTFLIVLGFGYPKKKAMVAAVGLAQIGEFSFILMALGASLNVISGEIRDILLAGALGSIAINPFLMRGCLTWVQKHWPEKVPEQDVLAHIETEEATALTRNIILLIGAGRVGGHVLEQINNSAYDTIIIDTNREKVIELRELGYHAIAGDAMDENILSEAYIEKALAVLITLPDPFAVRRVVELVQKLKPDARILVRSHNDEETRFFEQQNIDLAVSGTEEIARRMVGRLQAF